MNTRFRFSPVKAERCPIGSVFRPRPTSKVWRIAYIDEHGKRVTEPGERDRKASEEKLRLAETRVARIKVGLPVEGQGTLGKPLTDVVAANVAELRRLGRTAAYIAERERCLENLFSATGWRTLGQLSGAQLAEQLGKMAAAGLGSRTQNHVRDHLSAVCKFAVSRGWLLTNPVANVPATPKEKRGPRARRPFTLDEFRALAGAGRRAKLRYLVAGLSGLRRREMTLVEKADVVWEPRPVWLLRGEITKNGEDCRLPMLPECAAVLRPHWQKFERPGDRLFPSPVNPATFYGDMKRANVVRFDHRGLRLNWHSLRYFYAVQLGLRLPIQRVRILMRHATIGQTFDLYARIGLADLLEQDESLPEFGALDQALTPPKKP